MLGSKDASFRHLIESFPRLLLLSGEEHIKPMANYLESIGVPEGCLRNVLLVYPPILFYNIKKDISPRIMNLQKVWTSVEPFSFLSILMNDFQLLNVLILKLSCDISSLVQWIKILVGCSSNIHG